MGARSPLSQPTVKIAGAAADGHRRSRSLEPGHRIARFELVRLLGRGGMGEVWEALDPASDRRVALKLIKDAEASPQLIRRFKREVKAASAVEHPAVVKVFEVIEAEDGLPVMVMELLEGESLADRIDREDEMPVEVVASIMLSVVSAVGSAHVHGIVHRDLKPENIFLVAGAEGAVDVRVLDFGIAKLLADEAQSETTAGLTTTGAILGTPCYMAPEQVFGERDIDHRVDIWALGILLYEMLTGILPTAADNVGQVLKIIVTRGIFPLAEAAPDLPAELVSVVDRMLQRERDRRPSDLREVQAVLEGFAGNNVPAFGPAASSPPKRVSGERWERSEAETRATPVPDAGPRASGGTLKMSTDERSIDEVVASVAASIDPLGDTAIAHAASKKPPAPRSWGRYAAVAALAIVAGGLLLRPDEETPPAGPAASSTVVVSVPTPVPSAPLETQPPTAAAASVPRGRASSSATQAPPRAAAPPRPPAVVMPSSSAAEPVPSSPAPPTPPSPVTPGGVETELPPELGG